MEAQEKISTPINDELSKIKVLSYKELLENKSFSGLGLHQREITGVTYPKSSTEVQQIISTASKQKAPVYPVSCGKNWGYGKSCPPKTGCIVLDMHKMNRIIDFDPVLGSVEIEPGVTQGQLANFLKNTDWMMDCTGAGPNTSIMGNILERGFGHSPLGYRVRHFAITELILANGNIYNLSPPGKYAGRIGLSAGIHEIFTQNNIGVVTKVRIELIPRPECSLRCIVKLKDHAAIGEYINAMRELKSEGTVDALPHIGNHYRMLGMFSQFDFTRWDTKIGSNKSDINDLLKKLKISPWMATFSIFGNTSVAKAKAKRIRKKLHKVAKVYTIPYSLFQKAQSLVNWLSCHASWIPQIETANNKVTEISKAMGIFEGIPDNVALKGCYWRNKNSVPRIDIDPIDNGCGFFWLAPSLPMIGKDVEKLLSITENEFEQAGFEMAVTLTAVTSSLCQAIISLYYDTSNFDETQLAHETIKKLRKKYIELGWIPYRRAVDEMPLNDGLEQDALSLRKIIKQAIDPQNTIAPGRYEC
ncbi:FAD-binding oxidoreductase [Spartinivicinus poritis]|uniref:FAD-dependent oxidoreductase n=1 Tax=Spartinivicinus poritis TaxID=2994640 RepID=A0ABT5U4N9_9GAMM|nr:FAD-dependent oxidoreductase [Spartinivicinus sp. A2-2]MDE1461333.1 FAD-dependent oxidoreductase [Spartinivicinus sp. A2-2]